MKYQARNPVQFIHKLLKELAVLEGWDVYS